VDLARRGKDFERGNGRRNGLQAEPELDEAILNEVAEGNS